ncbi:hypothetical protein [Alicyclobacillus fastidiosus]|uniref:hypothetical protein n=1 Tax=Alicyclobacillus fastidiosus TaxID=392011 RepID=UPI0024E0A8FD|nr:hypothetical protein [Alicyclobacillus fastidiosus]
MNPSSEDRQAVAYGPRRPVRHPSEKKAQQASVVPRKPPPHLITGSTSMLQKLQHIEVGPFPATNRMVTKAKHRPHNSVAPFAVFG